VGPASPWLGHTKGVQHPRNVPGEVGEVYLALDCLARSRGCREGGLLCLLRAGPRGGRGLARL